MSMIDSYFQDVVRVFERYSDPSIASHQSAYLKNKFVFYGIMTDKRREIQKPFLVKSRIPELNEIDSVIRLLWEQQYRELHYFAQELLWKYKRHYDLSYLDLFEFMIENQSWWDTVDFLAQKPVGHLLYLFPDERSKLCTDWIESENLWLQRSTIIFQLKYKSATDTELLARNINALCSTKEFFLNKAIGWALREYSKTNPKWVAQFIDSHDLSPLSIKEGSKYI